MTPAAFRVLLLGWNEVPRAGEPDVPSIRPLVQELAPLAPLSVMLPHLPDSPLTNSAGARVTGLADLALTDALASRPRPDQRPGAWRPPAAPYVGAAEADRPGGSAGTWNAPAAPYLGATPGAAPAATLALTLSPAGTSQAAAPAPTEQVAPAEAAAPNPDHDQLLNLDEFARDGAEPEAGEANALDQPANDLAPDELSADELAPPPPPRVQATLSEALAALGVDLPATADLNFQVIQYARFATRRALLEEFAVIYAVDWPTWLAAMEIRQQTGRPLVLHVHDLALERAGPEERGWVLALERLALRRADLVLAASDEVAHRLHERYQLPPERLRTIAPSDTEAVNTILHQLEHSLPGRPVVAPLFPPTA
ncbi:glycosyltransferase [Hymenobacter sp. NST-14]|uniref:glycosyltransferase n=1 Tax=Hymenobacter piscis TaxID=2839984 RepID=UPI001C02A1D0|nr:glycosyltransferase [Hymenobacter piscis]MBT9394304.1 glycosyltransferase [Hymenobacter piscis]